MPPRRPAVSGLARLGLSLGFLACLGGPLAAADLNPAEPSPSPSPRSSAMPAGQYQAAQRRLRMGREPADAPALRHHLAEEYYDVPMDLSRAEVAAVRERYLSPGGRAWIMAVYTKAKPYWAYIAERLAARGLPPELIVLPMVESEFRPQAVSRSGAAGMWQFMRNSIGGYGIVIDDWRDDRRDFMKSTEAALSKLGSNYNYYDDWLLALAAYNCGRGKLDRARKKLGGQADYWELCQRGLLPRETRAYVPKFLGIASLVRYAGRYGLDFGWDEGTEWSLVDLDKAVDIVLLSEKSGIPLDLLRQANAELRYNVTPPEGSRYALKVPAEYKESVLSVLADKDLKLLRFYLYKVKSGDTLSALARHYGVSVAMIKTSNPNLKPNTLPIGFKLVIPALKETSPYEGAKPLDPKEPFNGSYVVKRGDSFWSISLKFGISPELLAEKNGMQLNSTILEGMRLKVPIM